MEPTERRAETGLFDVEITRDVRVPTDEAGVTLSADIYRPVSRRPVPALVTATLSRKDTLDQAGDVRRWFARHGYAGVLVDLRGTGLSDGVMRPTFHAEEADDALAAIKWVASQPWCDGNIGMWGFSSGATMTLRTASRRPPQLKAIIPIMGMLDPERDFVHPGGVRGGLASVAQWGLFNLINQILPAPHAGDEDQQRWRRRLDAEPTIVDFFRHGPGHAAWRERAIDPSLITTPALCVAGWNEMHCEGTVRAYEQLRGPKKLLVGPWGHWLPHRSPPQAIDFLRLATRWWDYWLKGIHNGVLSGPGATVYVQGAAPGWRSYEQWPPGKPEAVPLGARPATSPPGEGRSGEGRRVAVYEPDPTIGTQTSWWGGFMEPSRMDQHDDDLRAAHLESDVLASDMLIVGRPEVTVRLASGDSGTLPERLVVRLADVDQDGTSTLITEGARQVVPVAGECSVTLWPTAYRVGQGHRLRVVICDASFPRLWPSARRHPVPLAQVDLSMPIHTADSGDETGPSAPPPVSDMAERKGRGLWRRSEWEIARSPLDESVRVMVGDEHTSYTARGEHFHLRKTAFAARVGRTAPEAAVIEGSHTAQTRTVTGATIMADGQVRMTGAALWVRGSVTMDGMVVFSRTWTV